jgi:hypothetical protein
MPKPYERLLDARQRGTSFTSGSGSASKRKSELSATTIEQFRGFELSASANIRNGAGLRAIIKAELWYGPCPLVHNTKGVAIRTSRKGIVPYITRIVTKPELVNTGTV